MQRRGKHRSNHESTKFGKHEKGPVFLNNPILFRVFVVSFRVFILYSVYCLPWPAVALVAFYQPLAGWRRLRRVNLSEGGCILIFSALDTLGPSFFWVLVFNFRHFRHFSAL